MGTGGPAAGEVRPGRVHSVVAFIVEGNSFAVTVLVLFDVGTGSNFVVLEEFGPALSHDFLNYVISTSGLEERLGHDFFGCIFGVEIV